MGDQTYTDLLFIFGFGFVFGTAILTFYHNPFYMLFFEIGIVLILLYIVYGFYDLLKGKLR